MKGFLHSQSFGVKLLFFAFLSIFGLLLSNVPAAVLLTPDADAQTLRWIQFIGSVLGFALPAVVFAWSLDNSYSRFLQLKRVPSLSAVFLAVFAMLAVQPLIGFASWWNEQLQLPDSLSEIYRVICKLENIAKEQTLKLLAGNRPSDLFVNLFFLALVPAITEELFFRGALLRLFREKFGVHTAVWLTAVIFSAYHLQFFGFVPRALLGGLLGYLLVYSGSLYIPVIAHFTNNAALVLLSFLFSNGYVNYDVETLGREAPWTPLWVSIAVLAAMIWASKHKATQTK
ncbi:MAG: CPBP family intramembrane metalloprotease [Prevotellaceae bacterium]|jgi:membrane protease YdiL (CAAX protease family)|nr:CPBP family intramembrane metalloprotease [Prevotellaceae bacterium]